jgi:hypothetical protein
MARSTEQIFQDHMRALLNGDFPALIADYAADAVLMTMDGANVGKAAIQGYFVKRWRLYPISNCHHRTHCAGRLRTFHLDRGVRRSDSPARSRHLRDSRRQDPAADCLADGCSEVNAVANATVIAVGRPSVRGVR